jgi:plasmid stabilization system protein ParE
MKIEFLALAAAEYREAADYYESERDGLGGEFAEEASLTLQRIAAYPEAWPKLSARTRRCLLDRFPYALVYQLRGKDIRIIAVMHLKRRPLFWRDRMQKT